MQSTLHPLTVALLLFLLHSVVWSHHHLLEPPILQTALDFDPASSLVHDPDETRSIDSLVASRGLRLLTYRILTEDGYVVTLHRAVTPDYEPAYYNVFRKPVIIFHGVLTDTAIYFMNDPAEYGSGKGNGSCTDNFAVCLLNTGRYDLWIPNARGSRYSRDHLHLTDKDPAYWAFSWDHIALYDLPAFIDFILKETRHSKLGYIGYSQGSSTLFALMSIQPHYSSLISPFICWAPGVYLSHAKTIVRPVLKHTRNLVTKLSSEYLPSASFINPLLQYPACHHPVGLPICATLLQLIFGPTEHLNVTRIPTYFHYVPSAISNWQVAHYTQIGASGEFSRFDYGSPSTNYRHYGQPTPPLWPLWRINRKLKIVVMYGATDWFIDPIDARKLIYRLKGYGLNAEGFRVPSKTWNHIDFFMGQDAGRLLYPEVIKYLDLYSWGSGY